MAQKRIRELDIYTQLESGETGYVAPSSIYIALDSNNFSGESKKYSFESLFQSIHSESDKLTSLASASVSVTFGTTFSSVPLIRTFRVYRIAETYEGSGRYRMKDVAYDHVQNWLTTSGFSITIDSNENLTGVIIEYDFLAV